MSGKKLPHKAWVVVADGEKALFMVNEGDDQDFNLRVMRKDAQDNPAAQDWATDRPGRLSDGPFVHNSAVDDKDWHELEKRSFASDLAERFYGFAQKGRFDHLALIASRVVLSQLRQELHDEVKDRVIFEVPKVLTNHPVDEIEKLLRRDLAGAD